MIHNVYSKEAESMLFVNNGYVERIVDVYVEDNIADFEKNKLFYFCTLPIMWALTFWVLLKKRAYKIFRKNIKTNTLWVDGLSFSCNEIKKNAASWKALDIVYNFDFEDQQGVEGLISKYWIGMLNGQAVRNRFKIVKRELKIAISAYKYMPEVRIISIASGSAQVVLEAMEEMVGSGVNVTATLLDLDPTALAHSRYLAKKKNLEGRIDFIEGGTSKIKNFEKRPHIVEMVGFLDYRPDKKAIKLIKDIRKLNPEVFICSNIIPNQERTPLKYLFDWDMEYRKPNDFKKIINKGGFHYCSYIIEPVQLYTISICYN
ncbi:MAG: class I SAM-dependent methyltransferase family protein [Candidatus Moraniibacteriota bacterium]